MNHRQTIQAVARRLPHLRRDQVAEVLEVTAEVWADALAQPGESITLVTLGRLHVETQRLRIGGAVRRRIEARHGAQTLTRRMYFRFRPTGWLKEIIEDAHEA
jgi:nucleoid DNA-binding protein